MWINVHSDVLVHGVFFQTKFCLHLLAGSCARYGDYLICSLVYVEESCRESCQLAISYPSPGWAIGGTSLHCLRRPWSMPVVLFPVSPGGGKGYKKI
jgi:hypothetical protein